MTGVLFFFLCSKLFMGLLGKVAVLNVASEHASILVLRQRQHALCVQVLLKFDGDFFFLALHLGVKRVHGDVSFL